ncbi:hypothetical protein ATANTOWER_027628 [Ataeniobius toweri]|uniref:Uncharacterized protein n=1 Tax=Ataeniobius toweri TaxID=208326 RepID=A0ABU7C1N0_9TELE|nr:hypothetical protein [Ataeniobius toweri]
MFLPIESYPAYYPYFTPLHVLPPFAYHVEKLVAYIFSSFAQQKIDILNQNCSWHQSRQATLMESDPVSV